jgi:diguanylate cyclase (GGDEF)-like protein/PAS domain S-box-containing protein
MLLSSYLDYIILYVKIDYFNVFYFANIGDYLIGLAIGLAIGGVCVYLCWFRSKNRRYIDRPDVISSRILEDYPGIAFSCLIDEFWTMKYLSSNAYKLLGYANDEVINNNTISYNEIIHPTHRDFVKERYQEVVQNNTIFNEEYLIVTKDKQEKWVRESGTIVYDEYNQPLRIEGYINDITEEKEMLYQKSMYDTRYRSFIDNLDFPVLIYHDHHIINVNPSAVNFFKGRDRFDIEGIHVEEILDENYINYYRKRVKQIMDTKSANLPTNYKFKLLDGSTKLASLQTIPFFIKNELYLHIILYELDNSAYSTQQLRKTQRRNRDLILYMNEGIGVFQEIPGERDRKLVFANRNFYKFVKSGSKNLIYQRFTSIFNILSQQEVDKALSVFQNDPYELEVEDIDNSRYYKYLFFSNADNELVVQITDITDVKLANIKYIEEKTNLDNILEETGLIVWNWDFTTSRLDFDNKWIIDMGYNLEEFEDFSFQDFSKLIHPDDNNNAWEQLQHYLESDDDFFSLELRIKKGDGTYAWGLMRGKAIKFDDRLQPLLFRGTYQDITGNKEKDEEIKFLSMHDHLTGLANRRAYDLALQEIENPKNYPIAVILADVNGLKVTNDAFGHEKGDELLETVARVLKSETNDSDILARIGGDEFVLVCPKTNQKAATQLINKFHSIFKYKEISELPISVSFGFAIKHNQDTSFKNVQNLAESNMYQSKLALKNSRLYVVNLIRDKLFKIHPEEKQIVEMVNEYALKLIKFLDVTPEQTHIIDIATRYYNIGVISIDHKVFSCERDFNQAEETEYRKHVESVYRIMLSTYKYDEVALAILLHHERFDGSGYPSSLKGEDIPIASRIIACLATYSRHKIINNSRKKAINYIKSEKGKGFDPDLVDLLVSKVL